ncbi:MAG: ribbon-helix-helix protein, CopG family [Gammaproteobacteria bacterium]|nr:ribbon-helix-helix protein, CopG family [Gammaproteobacteria bacterium]
MPTSVRLDPETEALLKRLARRRGRTKSEVIREALRRLSEEPATPAEADGPYHAIADLIGIAGDGPEDLARDHKRLFREKLSRRRD